MIDLERFPDKQSFARYQPRLQAEWERFVSGATAAPDSTVIPFRIAESWKRSRSYGLDPVHYQSYVRMKRLNLRTRERQIATNPVAAYWLGSLAKRYAFNVSIFDAQGNSIALLPGDSGDISFANEMILGTNATALALLRNGTATLVLTLLFLAAVTWTLIHWCRKAARDNRAEGETGRPT